MGYAEAAGLPAIAGLYATIGALVAYFLFGPSRILVFGPDSSLLPLVAAAVVPLAAGDPTRAMALAAALAIMAGVMCLAGALARLGFVTDLLSRPIRVGYMNGIALTILVGQLPKLLGFSVDATGVVDGDHGARAADRRREDGAGSPCSSGSPASPSSSACGASRPDPGRPRGGRRGGPRGRRLRPLGGAEGRRRGAPRPAGDRPSGGHHVRPVTLFPTALGIALISFADTSVISHAFAARRGERVDADRELAALGAGTWRPGSSAGSPRAEARRARRSPKRRARGRR